ncbi:FKBP-type peptidyl-prolyl cis-trans isomerase [Haoranjiania flava]|uniref:Peptidyl-prolyl cis-trans isomerase n=1 Tax=Haoranjiania flava TaxID=1856322 RepID=A0AAE3LJY1_9BACT|nr:FKBP-type peptidyl-prolyl cis-trans isomerase [Haoranjiania flava]MCU7694242.1 hypothetical protein [Haoranjiania flava]
MKRTFLSLMTLFAIAITVSSCLKGTEPLQPRDPAAEKDTIQKFITSKGYTMVEDALVQGLMYQIVARGSETDTISNSAPVIEITFKETLLDGTVTLESAKAVFNLLKTIPFSQGAMYSLSKIGKGGHIRLVTPSKYGYGPYIKGKVPANSPLFYDIELLDVRETE